MIEFDSEDAFMDCDDFRDEPDFSDQDSGDYYLRVCPFCFSTRGCSCNELLEDTGGDGEQQWMEAMAKECLCSDKPCEGLMAGGYCDSEYRGELVEFYNQDEYE